MHSTSTFNREREKSTILKNDGKQSYGSTYSFFPKQWSENWLCAGNEEFCDGCLSILNINGTTIRVQKSTLVEKVKLVLLNKVDNCYALVDMGFYGDWLHLQRRTGKWATEFTALGVITLIKSFFLALYRHRMLLKSFSSMTRKTWR